LFSWKTAGKTLIFNPKQGKTIIKILSIMIKAFKKMDRYTESERFFSMQGETCKIAAGIAKAILRTILCVATQSGWKISRLNVETLF
jgi:hypothetical protein